MSKYIDYDAIDYRHDKLHDKSSEFLDGVIYMAERIEDAPSIDIVRCKECKFADAYKTISGEWRFYCMESGAGGKKMMTSAHTEKARASDDYKGDHSSKE